MKKAASLFFLFCVITNLSKAQYWQQKADFIIDVKLNDQTNTLQGFEKITYFNNSPDTLSYIWFHLWPNAYKNDRTAFSDQLLQNGSTDFYFSEKEQRGYINQLDFKVNGAAAKTEDHPQHIDILKVLLPTPLPPNQQITITTPFHVKLPFNFSRGGYDGKTFQLTQWYPKPAVYDRKGWHPMPYLDQGEFYSEFGNYDVRITLPKDYVVAATGELQNQEEEQWLKNRKVPFQTPKTTITKKPSTTAKKKTINKATIAKSNKVSSETKPDLKTLQFIQNNVHDFALFTDKKFIVEQDTCQLASGKIVKVATYYTPTNQAVWKNSTALAKEALRFYSNEVGEYPYATLSAVQGPKSFGGGMEYPTITLIAPSNSIKELDITLAHEIGHNWFYGILASNERDHPWMDEGLNTFYERKYSHLKYGEQWAGEEAVLQTAAKTHTDQPISTPSETFTSTNYNIVAYYKTSEWLNHIENKISSQQFQAAIQRYYQQWQFKHPQPEDLKAILAPYLQNDTAEVYGLLNTKGTLPQQTKSAFSIITPFKPKSFSNYLKNPTRNALLLSPAFGYNVYDKLMIGGVITNYKLPPSDFQFLAVPLYSTGAKKLNGIGKLSYTQYPKKGVKKIELFINGSAFSMNEFSDSKNERHLFGFQKLVPGVELHFKEKDPHSTTQKYIQWKSFLLQEEPYRLSIDSLFENGDTFLIDVVHKEKLRYAIHQLKLGIDNNRVLYPYSANITTQVSNNFVRLAFEGNYFFNYKKGGLNLRVFAGKFFYDENKTYPYGYYIDRFALNLSGANGEEDYTYSNYFIGRNRFEGFSSQQIMIRDGGFKIKTDLLSNKVGKTGNWLASVNLNTTVPDQFSPLSILPFRIPLRLFADIGTYAESWEANGETDRFLFNAGLHIPLLNETINFYFPIVYSSAFSDYTKSMYVKNRLFKTMTFSINLKQRDLNRFKQRVGL